MAEENYSPRGIGSNRLPCYICNQGGKDKIQFDMSAFVSDKSAGEQVVAMYEELGLHAKLDFRPYEPKWVQVKVGACGKHLPNLEKLTKLCSEDKKINPAKIAQSLVILS
jgi:hypothetical protein